MPASSVSAKRCEAAGVGSQHTCQAFVPEYRFTTAREAATRQVWPQYGDLVIRYVADADALAAWDAGRGAQPEAVGYWTGKRLTPLGVTARLVAAKKRYAQSLLPNTPHSEQRLARAALRRAENAMSVATGTPKPERRRGRPPTGKPRRKGKSGKGGKMPRLEGAALDERTRLLDLALAKCHAARGTPTSGTSWAELARTLDVHPSDLRAGRRSPALDRRLREYVGEACE